MRKDCEMTSFDALEVIPTRLLFPSHDNEFHTSQIGFVERAALQRESHLRGGRQQASDVLRVDPGGNCDGNSDIAGRACVQTCGDVTLATRR